MMPHQPNRAKYATERARLLFGQYRRGDANDPDIYVASVAAILADYPTETIRYVTDPRTGIAANPINPNWTGPPDIADVKRACEKHCGPTRRSAEREAAIRQQLDERKALPAPEERAKRPTYEELCRRCAEAGFPIGPQKHQPLTMKPADIMAKYNISQALWDALPNQSQRLGPAQSIGSPLAVNPTGANTKSGS
jgi:hypothetical protein